MITEADFLNQVMELAALYGWSTAHFRPAQTARGWRTPVQGTLGKGWPDLTLVRVRDRRLIFAELKSEKGTVSADQAAVLAALASLEDPLELGYRKRVETFVWRPSDFDAISEVLR